MVTVVYREMYYMLMETQKITCVRRTRSAGAKWHLQGSSIPRSRYLGSSSNTSLHNYFDNRENSNHSINSVLFFTFLWEKGNLQSSAKPITFRHGFPWRSYILKLGFPLRRYHWRVWLRLTVLHWITHRWGNWVRTWSSIYKIMLQTINSEQTFLQ